VEYGRVILPATVLGRLDAVLKPPTKVIARLARAFPEHLKTKPQKQNRKLYSARRRLREHLMSTIVSGAGMPLDQATRLGPYEIVALIGAGGMGEIYRARDTRLDRDVAIKVLTEHLTVDGRLRSRFRTEAKAIAALSHPNIVSIYDAELQQPPFFLVTELLQGETIRAAIERSPLGWRRALEIGAAVAEGLGAAHAAGSFMRT